MKDSFYVKFALLFSILTIFTILPIFPDSYKATAQISKDDIFQSIDNPYIEYNPDNATLYMYTDDLEDYIDPAASYFRDSLDLIGCTYEPPLTYHYLKRPYQLVPLTAKRMPVPQYFREVFENSDDGNKDKNAKYVKCTLEELYTAIDKGSQSGKNVLPKDDFEIPEIENDTKNTGKVRVKYRIEITPGIYYSPHPCFAKDSNGFMYHNGKGQGRSIPEDFGYSLSSLDDFQYFASRELVAMDYVYGIRRLFNPSVNCPILNSLMLKYIEDAQTFHNQLKSALNVDSDDSHYYGEDDVLLPYCDYDFEGVKEIDRYTFEITLNKPYDNFKYWLAMYFFSPIPWEADTFYSEIQSNEYKHFGFDSHPVGTGPYTIRNWSRYGDWGMDKYNGKFPVSNANFIIKSDVNPNFNLLAHGSGDKPPFFNSETGYGVDKNKNGIVDSNELAFYDLNKNGKYDGIENGEGFYFEDLNNNEKHDKSEKWYELPASYRTIYPQKGMPDTTNADLSKILEIREKQKKYLIEKNMLAYSQMQEKAEIELESLKKINVDTSKIGDVALGNLLDASRRLPLIKSIVRSKTYTQIYTLSFLANGYFDMYEPRSSTQRYMLAKFGKDIYLQDQWIKTGLKFESEVLLNIAYWGVNMLDGAIGLNNSNSKQASDNKRKIRQAIAIAFDLEEWIRKFGFGEKISKCFIPGGLYNEKQFNKINPNLWVYKKGFDGNYNRRSIEEAKKLMTEAGFPNGRNSDDEQLVIKIDSELFYDNPDEMEWFVRQFAKIGIKLDAENRMSIEDILKAEYQLFFTGWNADYPESENFALLFYGPNHESLVANKRGGMNRANYMNNHYDALYERMIRTSDPDEKYIITRQMNEQINFDSPVFGIVNQVRNVTRFPWMINYKSFTIANRQIAYLRIDTEKRKKQLEKIKSLYD
ncbi:MAG: hypothetical protein K8S87_07780 [Planctomycetes bacterium]|nr:hypothetical protein [Planctomycetota bacterium]